MKIILCVTNDIVTDQRVNRIAGSLCTPGNEIFIAGIQLRNSPPLALQNIKAKRFSMLFRKGPLFYAEYNLRLFFMLLFMKPDAVVANDLDTLPASFLFCRFRRARLIYDSHEYFTELPELVERKIIRRIWESIEQWILPQVSYSYTVSPSIAEGYKQKYGVNMQVIRNLPRRMPYSELPRQNSAEKIIIYQGALNMGRGLENAIRAMQYLNNARLLIAGSGYFENDLQTLVISLKLQEKVRFLGRLLPEELYTHTCTAGLGISLEENLGLNYYYALPNKLFDYIQARIPVLVSDLPEMAAIVKNYGVGRTISWDSSPQQLAAVITEMLDDENLRQVWQKNLETASAELCWENEESKLLAIYRKALFEVPLPEQKINEPDKKRRIGHNNQDIL